MEKIILTKEYLSKLKLINRSNSSLIYTNKNGDIIKIFTPFYLNLNRLINIDIEAKLMNKEHYYISNEIIIPNAIIYDSYGNVIGYKSARAKGIDLNEFERNFTMQDRTNLKKLNEIYKKLENIVKKNKDIVFPDLCTCDNIYIDRKNNLSLIDYNGMQIGKHKAFEFSSTLHQESNNYMISKYYQDNLFTKNLDKKSLIILYFLLAFNIDLNKVGLINPETNKKITLEEIFDLIGIEDYEMYEKIKRIFNDTKDNEYLDDTIDRLEKDNNLIIYATNGTKCLKKLVRK